MTEHCPKCGAGIETRYKWGASMDFSTDEDTVRVCINDACDWRQS